mmetsp:Transcript_82195/g.150353  ORF Transcript_82195/g.150353 Transcript_82195/m.150353 type:complete len:256 (-) Transcript_82195:1955-2722(-)
MLPLGCTADSMTGAPLASELCPGQASSMRAPRSSQETRISLEEYQTMNWSKLAIFGFLAGVCRIEARLFAASCCTFALAFDTLSSENPAPSPTLPLRAASPPPAAAAAAALAFSAPGSISPSCGPPGSFVSWSQKAWMSFGTMVRLFMVSSSNIFTKPCLLITSSFLSAYFIQTLKTSSIWSISIFSHLLCSSAKDELSSTCAAASAAAAAAASAAGALLGSFGFPSRLNPPMPVKRFLRSCSCWWRMTGSIATL